MTALLALALAAAPGCPAALAEAAPLPPPELAARAPGIVERLELAGAGGPVAALRALAGAAASPGPDGAAAARRFRAALSRHCALAALPQGPDGEAERARLAEILSRPEFRRAEADPHAIRRAILGLWARIFETLGTTEAERYASVVRAVFLAAAAAAALLLALSLRRRRAGRVAREEEALPLRALEQAPAGAERAEEALSRGDAREAVRQAFLAVLGSLERAGRIPRGRALTNGEVVGSLAAGPGGGSPALPGEVARLAALFDRTIYGLRPVGLDEAREAVAGALRVASAGEAGR